MSMLAVLYKRLQKMLLIGPRATLRVFYTKCARKKYERDLRKKIADLNEYCNASMKHSDKKIYSSDDAFIESILLRSIPHASLLFAEKYNEKALLEKADFFAAGGIEILGSGKQVFKKMPWHEDIRLRFCNPNSVHSFDPTVFFADVAIQSGATDDIERDIKISWELSRCQQLSFLGYAYAITQKEEYVLFIVHTIMDWIAQNPYPYGVNWANPMEVALRAINWIIALDFCKKSSQIHHEFLVAITESLHNHLMHLEHTWEFYDARTCNHYLANLVGYLYLCWFFNHDAAMEKKIDWCVKELAREFEKQVFDEGASYEGSTAYHRLVTELWTYAYLLSAQMGRAWSHRQHKKLQRMLEFQEWCAAGDTFITIGDNDSGSVILDGLSPSIRDLIQSDNTKTFIKQYDAFGISIIKTDRDHITLRHHAYHARQPSGHFHADALSITWMHNNTPLIIDPGSYVYTPSVSWRNYFRSMKVHNTFMLAGCEPLSLTADLFSLAVPHNKAAVKIIECEDYLTITSYHDWYARYGIRAHRMLQYDKKDEHIALTDWWSELKTSHSLKQTISTAWNFTLHPCIEVQTVEDTLICSVAGQKIASITSSSLSFAVGGAWFSPEYGVKQETKAIYAQRELSYNERVTIMLISL